MMRFHSIVIILIALVAVGHPNSRLLTLTPFGGSVVDAFSVPQPATGPSCTTTTMKTICSHTRGRGRHRSSSMPPPLFQVYGRGAEIWPEPSNEVVLLKDSFPNGQIPYAAVVAIGQSDMESIHQRVQSEVVGSDDESTLSSSTTTTTTGLRHQRRRRRSSKQESLRRILRRAAAKEEIDMESEGGRGGGLYEDDDFLAVGGGNLPTWLIWASRAWTGLRKMDRTPPVLLAFVLLFKGLVRPLDVTVVAILTTYFIVLQMSARSTRDLTLSSTSVASYSYVPVMPATPPQGHVPTMVANPLGLTTTSSGYYEAWLRMGAVVGCMAPVVWVVVAAMALSKASTVSSIETMGAMAAPSVVACARHLFVLCGQIVAEAAVRQRVTTPLPIRILVPCLYNTCRLAYLWNWVHSSYTLCLNASASTSSSPLLLSCKLGLGLAVLNMTYWALNLFGFLIPIGVMKYMRAHFFGVEAMEVTTRIELEETVGLIPNYNSGNTVS